MLTEDSITSRTKAAEEAAPAVSVPLYEQLAAASPEERSALVLQLIQHHPEGRLELPIRDGQPAILTGVRLGRDDLRDRIVSGGQLQPWWSADTQGINLKGADLRGAHLGLADLQYADLREADMRGAVLRGAVLHGAHLERADLRGADLAGADLREAALGEVNLQESVLEEANFQGAGLRFANFRGAVLESANFGQADLWGAVLEKAVLTRADLRGATLKEANLQGADLTQANLQGTVLEQTDFRGARLCGVDFQNVDLRSARLEGAVLTDSRLDGVDLSKCNITGVHLAGARLERTRLRQEQLGGAIGEELAGRYEDARLGYLALERNFVALGDPGGASWAYRRRRRMEKFQARKLAQAARDHRQWRTAGGWYAKYAADQAVEWLCDYGESVSRVLLTMLTVFIVFTLIYGLTDGILRVVQTPNGPVLVPTHNPVDWVNFSMIAMTTSGKQPFGLLPRNEWIQMLTGIQSLLGIALAGLVGFVFGNKARHQ